MMMILMKEKILIFINKSTISDNFDEKKEKEDENDILIPAEEINEDEQHK